mmetsp:Transcript_21386/g.54463  ORF Transcript_21386/g.54463 Transcript_21386/m.54463 type:complete len:212 (+) Transcript_21386:1239-1874(+)
MQARGVRTQLRRQRGQVHGRHQRRAQRGQVRLQRAEGLEHGGRRLLRLVGRDAGVQRQHAAHAVRRVVRGQRARLRADARDEGGQRGGGHAAGHERAHGHGLGQRVQRQAVEARLVPPEVAVLNDQALERAGRCRQARGQVGGALVHLEAGECAQLHQRAQPIARHVTQLQLAQARAAAHERRKLRAVREPVPGQGQLGQVAQLPQGLLQT